MVESGVGRDSPCPCAKIAGRLESVARPVNTPECFHAEILSNSAVADDANNPGVDFLLVLPKERLEGLQVAPREPFQQFHPPLSIPNYWFLAPMVTAFFGSWPFPFPGKKFKPAAVTMEYKRRRPGRSTRPGLLVSAKSRLVDVVLLPVKGGVGLDDDVLVRGVAEFVDQHGLAGLQGFCDFRIHADREVRTFVIGGGHLARFGLDFVAKRGDGLDHTRAGAIRAGLAEDALKRLFGALAGDADEAELVEGQRL